jgi:hypothetical protein
MNIYLYVNEKVEGPYTQDQLFNEVRKRSLPMSTLAKEEGSEEWVAASQFFPRNEKPKSQSPSLVSVSKTTAVTSPEVAAKTDTKGNLSAETPITQINNVETHFVVGVHFAFGVLLFVAGAFMLLVFATHPSDKAQADALQLLVICFSGGVGLFIAGIILAWLHECVARLRNIELNTAKAVEKLAK